MAVAVDELRGKRHIPLNRLHRLPKEIAQKIVPMAFPGDRWRVCGDAIEEKIADTDDFCPYRLLTPEEMYALDHFYSGIALEEITRLTADRFSFQTETAWKIVSNLFFEFARLRVCHPTEAIDWN
jgi:hypothetical protein